eukprot:765506-Hanusia_phi.AAC.5
MHALQLFLFPTGLALWLGLYYALAVVQRLDPNGKTDEQVRVKLEDDQTRRFFLLLLHGVVYTILASITAMSFQAGQAEEVYVLSTSLLFAFLLYVGEEIGILQMNRSLHTPLPAMADMDRADRLYYRDSYADGIAS